MFKVFIERPVLSTVISILIVVLGLLGLQTLPISQYPEIAPPTIAVSASYTGANADVMLNSVIVPLEEQINGVEDMAYITSTASNNGTATITISFKLGTNADMAAVNVQNRVARATPLLPQEVTRAGVTVTKRQSSNVLVLSLYSDNPSYDQTFLQNYANINLVPQLKRVKGVGDVSIFGQMDYSMRIWLRPDIMASYGLMPADITAALQDQNLEAAPGQFGEMGGQAFQYTIKYKGRLKQASEFGNIVVRADPDGQILRLKDIARIEMGALSYATFSETMGKPAVPFAIAQIAGSNAKEVIEGCLQALEEAEENFPKGVAYASFVNANDFLDASIEKVISTLIEAFLLVFLVVFLFLQDWRSTLIPAISVPVAIVGTFCFLSLFGFTINLLTLFALVLAIGIVVDDAIVVVEAIHAKLDAGAPSPKQATLDAMGEITGAIVSITLVMAAVFVPVSFISGSSGVFFKQFGLTLAIAIILSAINALTLSPVLCVLLLKPHDPDAPARTGLLHRFHAGFNAAFDAVTRRYQRAVSFLSHKLALPFIIIAAFGGLFLLLQRTTPTDFVPSEDLGTMIADIKLPASASVERTTEVLKEVGTILAGVPEIHVYNYVAGRSVMSGAGSNYGLMFIKLKPWNERKNEEQGVKAIIAQLMAKTGHIRDARVLFFSPPTLPGFSMTGGFEFQLQDRTGGDLQKFAEVNNTYLAALNQRPEIQFATTAFDPTFPQYEVTVDVAKAKVAGLSVSDILAALQGYYGGLYASDLNSFGKQFRVMVQAEAPYRASPEGLNNVFVRNATGTMAPINGFIDLKKVYGPQSITRFNLYTSIAINGTPAAGYSSGDAIKAVEEVAAQVLPTGYGYEFSGLTLEEISSGSQTGFIFLLVIVFVFFLLAAQYESYILPLAVLLSLPIGLAGAFVFAWLFGITNNIYVQITLIMLVGLLAKNAILIVEFALQRRRNGLPLVQAAMEGAVARLRPILMTSFAFIFGLLPLMLASGAGAIGNQAIGTAAIGGMLIGTVFGIFVIPALFIVFRSLHERIAGGGTPAVEQRK